MRVVTAERLKDLLDYDPETGVFRWKTRRGPSAPAGSVAGTVSKASRENGGGYRHVRIDGHDHYAHRLAWFYVTGEWPDGQIDHRDLNRDNNAFANLRPATRAQNGGNRRAYTGKDAPLKGAYWHKGARRWRSSIQHNGISQHLGLFDTAEEAHAAYCRAAEKLFGDFARAA